MQSFKSKVFNLVLRNRHLLEGKLRKDVFDDNTSIQGFRDQCEKSAARMSKIPQGVAIKNETIEGINSEWYIPENSNPDKVILYMHGGGYVSGSCSDHRGFVSSFAKNTGYKTLIFDYRLAPEHPFPAAIEDSIKVYKALLQRGFSNNNILFAGESAGGGLTLALLLALKQNNIPYPVAAVSISPWTDLTCKNPSYITKNKVSPAPMNSWFVFSKHYVGKDSATNPLISPLYGELAGLPPIFINCGESDEMYDDGRLFYEKAKAAGVQAKFRSGENMVHCYPLLSPMFKEATEAMNEIVEFAKHHLK